MTRKVEGRALFQGGTARLCLVPGGDAAYLHSVAQPAVVKACGSPRASLMNPHALALMSKYTKRNATKQGE